MKRFVESPGATGKKKFMQRTRGCRIEVAEGSSARWRQVGSWGAATATLLCSPPLISDGRCFARSSQTEVARAVPALVSLRSAAFTRQSRRGRGCFQSGKFPETVMGLKHRTGCRLRKRTIGRSSRRLTSSPAIVRVQHPGTSTIPKDMQEGGFPRARSADNTHLARNHPGQCRQRISSCSNRFVYPSR